METSKGVAVRSVEGELVVRRKFTDTDMIDYLQRHHTQHKKLPFCMWLMGMRQS